MLLRDPNCALSQPWLIEAESLLHRVTNSFMSSEESFSLIRILNNSNNDYYPMYSSQSLKFIARLGDTAKAAEPP